jgi:hypothetical protein
LLVIFRDPADWMGAVFNGWYDHHHLDTHSVYYAG